MANGNGNTTAKIVTAIIAVLLAGAGVSWGIAKSYTEEAVAATDRGVADNEKRLDRHDKRITTLEAATSTIQADIAVIRDNTQRILRKLGE